MDCPAAVWKTTKIPLTTEKKYTSWPPKPPKPSKTFKKEVIINKAYGAFLLSDEAITDLRNLGVKGEKFQIEQEIKRDDPRLIRVFDLLGSKKATGNVYGIPQKLEKVAFELEEDQEFSVYHEDGFEMVGIRKRGSTRVMKWVD